jgi:D-glycero-beta-D-manno-heptose-7-phosphate kinase
MPTLARWKSTLKKFSDLRVLVIGDMMLDQYLTGRVSRISPEAPVPIVDVQSESFFPGGASNVARNLRSLSAKVSVLGIIGNDAIGRTLSDTLKGQGIEIDGLLRDSERPTTLKTRIMAQHQQVVRFDRESRQPLSSKMLRKALSYAEQAIAKADAVIFENYGKGFIQQEFLDQCIAIAHRAEVRTFADPNVHHRIDYRGLTGITPNRNEAFWMAHEAAEDAQFNPLKDKPLLDVGRKLLLETQIENVLITLGEHGMCLFREGYEPHHIPTAAQEVFDVSGAGDTAISVFTLGICAGLDPVLAAYLSNQASGIVVGKAGTATVSPSELLKQLNGGSHK